jgi:YD repeat-containing protein
MKRSHRAALATSALALASAASASETITYNYDALGRLATVKHSGDVNAGQAHSLCYDRAGNREIYKSSAAGTLADCPTQTPTPTPTPSNSAPVARRDAATLGVFCNLAVAVLGNDYDDDGDDLTITGATSDAYVTAVVPSTKKYIDLWAGHRATTTPVVVPYTISDGNGGTATGYIDVTVTAANSCQGTTDRTAKPRKSAAASGTAADILFADLAGPASAPAGGMLK